MANFDYETGARKPDLSSGSNALGVLLLVAIVLGIVVLFSMFGGGTAPTVPGEAGATAGDPATLNQPAADATAPVAPAAAD